MMGTPIDNAQEIRVKLGQSINKYALDAANEISEQIAQPGIGLILTFFSRAYDTRPLLNSLGERFPGVPIIGCTSAGEIGPAGYSDGGISAVSIHADDLQFELGIVESLTTFDPRAGQLFAHRLRAQLRDRVPSASADNSFALMLIDGLSVREESVARAFYDGLGGIRLMGGSAGDGLAFERTYVVFDGRMFTDAAVLLVATTPFLTDVFKTQNYSGSDDAMVVTGALPAQRIVTEINGCPAAAEYARAVGTPFDALDPMVFAAHPVVVQFGNADFVRSIQKVNPDHSLTLFCAIDEGIVFHVAKNLGMANTLNSTLAEIHRRIGPTSFIIGFDCILRNIEMKKSGQQEAIGEIVKSAKVLGFSTYGEQYCGIHINQTLTGVAFGKRRS